MIATHTDVVGSLLRPPERLKAREAAAAGRLGRAVAPQRASVAGNTGQRGGHPCPLNDGSVTVPFSFSRKRRSGSLQALR